MNERAKNCSSAARAYVEIRDHILKCEFKPGEILNERRLAEHLHISRTPVREALYKLEMEGLVKKYPNAGIIVAELSARDVRESFEVRQLIEPFAAGVAALALAKAELQPLLAGFEEIADIAANIDYARYYSLDQDLHNLIIRSTANSRLISISRQMYVCVERLRWIDVRIRPGDSTAEHIAIIRAILDRNAELAKNLMADHLQNVGEALAKVI